MDLKHFRSIVEVFHELPEPPMPPALFTMLAKDMTSSEGKDREEKYKLLTGYYVDVCADVSQVWLEYALEQPQAYWDKIESLA